LCGGSGFSQIGLQCFEELFRCPCVNSFIVAAFVRPCHRRFPIFFGKGPRITSAAAEDPCDDYVLVVPLDFSSHGQPAPQVPGFYLIDSSVPHFGCLEAAFLVQLFLVKRQATPEEQSDAVLEFAVADDGVAIQEPERDGRATPCLSIRQVSVDFPGQQVTDLPILGA